jgi:hypothetical protein
MPEAFPGDPFDGVWNTSDWDENFWARSLQTSLGVGIGATESNSVWGQAQGI